MENCFRKLSLGLPEDHKIFKEYKSFDYGQVEVKNKVYHSSKTFKQYQLPKDYFLGTELFEVMKDLNLQASIFLIESGHFYNWHRDAWRNVTLNLTLSDDENYLVLFAPDANPKEHTGYMMYERYIELKYDHKKFVLFNTQIPHFTITRGNTDRYLLSIAYYSGNPTNALKKLPSDDFTEFENVIQYFSNKNMLND
jgi:hypothetical protein